MAKLQIKVPRALGEVIARVKVKTHSKSLTYEYLLYLARFIPSFPIKDYGNSLEENCTLDLDETRYESDFSEYRLAQNPIIRWKNEFFRDALSRGATMYEAGYRLSNPKKAAESELQPDSSWRSLAVKAGAILNFSKNNGLQISDLISKYESHTLLMPATFFLFEKFADWPVNADAEARKILFESHIEAFENKKNDIGRIATAAKFFEEFSGPPLDLRNFVDWDSLFSADE